MSEDNEITPKSETNDSARKLDWATLPKIYDGKKITWFFLTISTVCLSLMSSEELWNYYRGQSPYSFIPFFYFAYIFAFLVLSLYLRYLEYKNKHFNNIFFISITTLVFDLLIIMLFGFFTLRLLNIETTNIINGVQTLLFLGITLIMGVSALSSITFELLRKQLDEINKRIEKSDDKYKEFLDVLNNRKESSNKRAELSKSIRRGLKENEE